MEIKTFNRAKEIIEQLDELKKFEDFGHVAKHFEFCNSYSTNNYDTDDTIIIPPKYNKRFFEVLDDIIQELENELEAL